MPPLHFKPITPAEALRRGYVSSSSRYYQRVKALGLRALLLEEEGDILVGPAPDLIEVTQRLLRAHPADIVVDLCCGTAATSLAARAAGAATVLAVDRDPSAARENLREQEDGVHILRADYRSWLPRRRVDVVIFDPPRMTRDMAMVVRLWHPMADLMVTWVGARDDAVGTLAVGRALARGTRDSISLGVWEAHDLILAFTAAGADRLRDLRGTPWTRRHVMPGP